MQIYFCRYYTGLGSKGLDLKDDYLSKVREETKSADMNSGRFDEEFINEEGDRQMGKRFKFFRFS